jgi:hypothetical protein
MADNSKRLFKKFSDFKNESKNEKLEEVNPSDNIMPDTDSSRPMNPNTPKDTKKGEKFSSRKNIIPKDQNVDVDTDADDFQNDIDEEETKHESKVETFGKVAKFPKNVKASKAYNFMENVKISKKSIWYLMVEKMDINGESLQLVKYNYNEGVDLNKFVNELKQYYLNKYKDNKSLCESINKIEADGNDKYSIIKGIAPVEVDGKKLITKITEDLIKLLSK